MALRSLRVTLLTIAFVLSGCAKAFVPNGVSDANETTGARNKNGVPFTTAAISHEFEALKNAIDPSSRSNMALAESIVSVDVARFDLTGNMVNENPAQVEIRLKLRDAKAPFVFRSVLSSAGATKEARAMTDSEKLSGLVINSRCLDVHCSSVEARLTKLSDKKRTAGESIVEAEAGLIFRVRTVKTEVLGPFDAAGKANRLTALPELIRSAPTAELRTTEVAWGPAVFDLTAGDLTANGDLVATGGTEENVSVSVKGAMPIEGRLLGNSNRGDLLLRLADGAAWAFLRISIIRAQGDQPGTSESGPDAGDTTPTAERYIPFDLSNPLTRLLQDDLQRPEIQTMIAEFKSEKWGMRQYLSRAYPNLAVMVDALRAKNLPPELIFITRIESGYFNSPGFPISVSSTKAVGPWQFMPGTATGLGLSIKPVSFVKATEKRRAHWVADACDDRANLARSSVAAAKYLRYLFDLFQTDPRLAIMAYNGGEGNISKAVICANDSQCRETWKPNKLVQRLRDAQVANFNYWTIRELKMAPAESITYVARFIGAQFVGREPSRHGITVETTGYPTAPASCQ